MLRERKSFPPILLKVRHEGLQTSSCSFYTIEGQNYLPKSRNSIESLLGITKLPIRLHSITTREYIFIDLQKICPIGWANAQILYMNLIEYITYRKHISIARIKS